MNKFYKKPRPFALRPSDEDRCLRTHRQGSEPAEISTYSYYCTSHPSHTTIHLIFSIQSSSILFKQRALLPYAPRYLPPKQNYCSLPSLTNLQALASFCRKPDLVSCCRSQQLWHHVLSELRPSARVRKS
jgi:hypothetical protein